MFHREEPQQCTRETQVDDEILFFKVSVVAYVFLYADFGRNTQKILARTVFTENGEFMYMNGKG